MSTSRDHHVALRFVRGYEFIAEFTDRPGLAPIVFDEPPPLGEGTGPNAAAVLAAAVGDCLAASFAFCARKVRMEIADLSVSVSAHVSRNDQGHLRVIGIDVALDPSFRDADPARTERCERLFEDFCVVTESVRRGIAVNVRVGHPSPSPERRQSDTHGREVEPSAD